VGAGPISVADERRIFSTYGIDALVARNADGVVNRTKLTAAVEMGIETLLIVRPPLLEGVTRV